LGRFSQGRAAVTSWVESAQGSDFPIENLPLGIFSVGNRRRRAGVAIGDFVLDLVAIADLLDDDWRNDLSQPVLNALLARGHVAQRDLRQRLTDLSDAGFDGMAFVGVPRTMADGEGSGVAPTDALKMYEELVANRGVILIPTREGEQGRFEFKCNQGANYGMTQLLYSDAIVGFLADFAENSDHRPEILLSFGFVPKVETRVGLIDWLIQDPGNAAVAGEQEFVRSLASRDPADKRALMVDLYKRVIDGVADLGFPLSIHFEATYGVSGAAFETFNEMLAYWSPDR